MPNLVKLIRPSAGQIAAARRMLHLKAAVILAITVASYCVLVIVPAPLAVKMISTVTLVVGLTLVGTGIMHDANHGAFSRSMRVNRLFGYTMDLVGGSSLLWRFKHNILHHGNTNVVGIDRDLNFVPLARLAPQQPWRPWHRYQHLYLWPFYGLLAIRWVLGSDAVNLTRLRTSKESPASRPRAREVAILALGKVVHIGWAVAIPLAFHPWWVVLAFYLACSWGASLLLVVIFQVAHCVEEADFVTPDADYRGRQFQLHQLQTTVDVRCAVRALRPVVRFVMGGLDYQIEHHLVPGLPHTIYPLVAQRLAAACTAHRLPYRCHASLTAAVRSHVRWLKAIGTAPTTALGGAGPTAI
jgi:linoleoyl-CoA desaturase